LTANHLVFLVEEPSTEAFLREFLPGALPPEISFEVHPHQGKSDLLKKLEGRLRGYAKWLPDDWRIVVVVDRDNEDCKQIKRELEIIANRAGLRTKSTCADSEWQIVNRVAIEELEAWYFGDWSAVKASYERVGENIPNNQKYRNPDAITGGTWEAFERVMRKYDYFEGGLMKIDAARSIGKFMNPPRNNSPSFKVFWAAIKECTVA
jgi:hypothetical protein